MADVSAESWSSPKPFAYGLVAGGCALLIGAFVASSDTAGAILMVIAALLLFSFGGSAAIVRPRLRLVHADGGTTVTVRTIFGARTYASSDVERIRILEFRRMGRRVAHLEFEFDAEPGSSPTGDDLDDVRIVVLGRWELGADVNEVADAFDAAGFHVER